MRIIITGANGFFGKNLVAHLETQGHSLVLIDKLVDNAELTSIYQCDVAESLDTVQHLFEGADACIHLANRARIEPSWDSYSEYYRVNITASQNVFKLCQQKNVKQFFYFSSSSVYGNNGAMAQSESSSLCPSNPYAVSKAAAEMALTVQSQTGRTELVVVRPFTMYGDHMDMTANNSIIIGRYLAALAQGRPLEIQGTGTQSRDFIHVSDAIRAFDLIMKHAKHGDVYNIGTGVSVAIQTIADAVSSNQVRVPDRIGQVDVTRADITKLEQLGFEPRVWLMTWLKNAVAETKIKL